jgi:hypothetical protein
MAIGVERQPEELQRHEQERHEDERLDEAAARRALGEVTEARSDPQREKTEEGDAPPREPDEVQPILRARISDRLAVLLGWERVAADFPRSTNRRLSRRSGRLSGETGREGQERRQEGRPETESQ